MSGFDSNFFDYVLGRSGDVIGTLLQQAGAGHGLGQATDPFSNNGYFTSLADRITNNKYQQQRSEAEYKQKQQNQGQKPPGSAVQGRSGTYTPIGTGSGFFDTVLPLAQAVEERTGVPALLSAAVAANETGMGNAPNGGQRWNSYHGIRGTGSAGSTPGGFRANNTPQESFDDFANLLTSAPQYSQAWGQYQQTHDTRQLLSAIAPIYADRTRVEDNGQTEDVNWNNRVGNLLNQAEAAQASLQSRAANPQPEPQWGQSPGGGLVSAAQGWIGTPYRLGGFSRGGIDCSALVLAAAQQAGRPLPQNVRTAQQIHNVVQQVRPDMAQPGDLVFFQGTYEGNPGERDTHVGIVTGPGTMISAAGSGVGTQRYTDPYWDSKITGFGRLP